MNKNPATYAGCIEVYTGANVLLNNITATENEAKYGGVIYSKESTFAICPNKELLLTVLIFVPLINSVCGVYPRAVVTSELVIPVI